MEPRACFRLGADFGVFGTGIGAKSCLDRLPSTWEKLYGWENWEGRQTHIDCIPEIQISAAVIPHRERLLLPSNKFLVQLHEAREVVVGHQLSPGRLHLADGAQAARTNRLPYALLAVRMGAGHCSGLPQEGQAARGDVSVREVQAARFSDYLAMKI